MIQWHLLHSKCCVTTTSVKFQHILNTQNKAPATKWAFSIPTMASLHPLSVPIDLPIVDFHINGITECVILKISLLCLFIYWQLGRLSIEKLQIMGECVVESGCESALFSPATLSFLPISHWHEISKCNMYLRPLWLATNGFPRGQKRTDTLKQINEYTAIT